jgi:hypothetical protein
MHEHQPTIWDWAASEAAKQAGIDQAGENKKQLLEYARGIARELARGGKVISADDVQLEIENRGISVHALGNAAGGLFRGKEWIAVGRVKSKRQHAHANWLTTWRLREI